MALACVPYHGKVQHTIRKDPVQFVDASTGEAIQELLANSVEHTVITWPIHLSIDPTRLSIRSNQELLFYMAGFGYTVLMEFRWKALWF
jgi:hypothetical protein